MFGATKCTMIGSRNVPGWSDLNFVVGYIISVVVLHVSHLKVPSLLFVLLEVVWGCGC